MLTEAIAKGGSTLRDYVDSRGEPGYFQLDYFVYGREGEPCRVCGTPIRIASGRAARARTTARAASADAARRRCCRDAARAHRRASTHGMLALLRETRMSSSRHAAPMRPTDRPRASDAEQ